MILDSACDPIFGSNVFIIFAKVCGYIATRFGQLAVLGELITGVLVGPSVIDLLHIQMVSRLRLIVSIGRPEHL